MTKPRPLKNKRMDLFYKTHPCDNCVTNPKGDFCKVSAFESAVSWLKDDIWRNSIFIEHLTESQQKELLNKIDKAFYDVVEVKE